MVFAAFVRAESDQEVEAGEREELDALIVAARGLQNELLGGPSD